MNTDNNITSTNEAMNGKQQQMIVEQINRTQQFGRMPQRHEPSYTEKYHYHYRPEETPDERED